LVGKSFASFAPSFGKADDSMLDMIGNYYQAKRAQRLQHSCFGLLPCSNDRAGISLSRLL